MSASIRKRALSSAENQAAIPKRSKKQVAKATSNKSQYFTETAGETQVQSGEIEESELSSAGSDEGSNFDEDNEASSPAESEDDDDEYNSDDAPKSHKNSKPRSNARPTTAIRTKGSDLWRTGVKTGLGPGTQVVIKKPQARPAGKTPYSDETIHANTILFLQDLKANNDREWLKSKIPTLIPNYQ